MKILVSEVFGAVGLLAVLTPVASALGYGLWTLVVHVIRDFDIFGAMLLLTIFGIASLLIGFALDSAGL